MRGALRVRIRVIAVCIVGGLVAACGSSSDHDRATTVTSVTTGTTQAPTTTTATTPPPAPKPPPPPSHPQLLPAAIATAPTPLTPAVRWNGKVAAWIERTPSGVAVMRFDQSLLELHLHSGTIDAGTLGWRYGPAVAPGELTHLVAAFNGGFRLSTGAGGFEAYGRVAVGLRAGIGSIVTYTDGTTDIGSWQREVPAPGKRPVSVRQNLSLLVDHGAAAPNVGCTSCWGATLRGVPDPARSGLGITAGGRLVWVGGENLTAAQLASGLISAGAVRAVELDINPEWVAGYFYGHRGGKGPLAPVPALPSQQGIPGQFLVPWSRDFFTIVAR